jgi:hypothetical protein
MLGITQIIFYVIQYMVSCATGIYLFSFLNISVYDKSFVVWFSMLQVSSLYYYYDSEKA